jgi:hypothetical protein
VGRQQTTNSSFYLCKLCDSSFYLSKGQGSLLVGPRLLAMEGHTYNVWRVVIPPCEARSAPGYLVRTKPTLVRTRGSLAPTRLATGRGHGRSNSVGFIASMDYLYQSLGGLYGRLCAVSLGSLYLRSLWAVFRAVSAWFHCRLRPHGTALLARVTCGIGPYCKQHHRDFICPCGSGPCCIDQITMWQVPMLLHALPCHAACMWLLAHSALRHVRRRA